MPATRITRSPPLVGTLNGCDSQRLAVHRRGRARLLARPARLLNSARPIASVVAVTVVPPIATRTVWPGASLPIDSRTTRTVTVPVGSSGAGKRPPVDQRRVRHLPWAEATGAGRQDRGRRQEAEVLHARTRPLAALLAESRVGVVGGPAAGAERPDARRQQR